MRRLVFLFLVLNGFNLLISQNDVDAIRYSRIGINGTSRFVAMGGAFGAIGADLSCAAYNPGGLGLYRKGDIAYGGGLKFINNNGTLSGKSTTSSDAAFAFNNFGVSVAYKSKFDDDSRHVIAFTNTQLQNFNQKVSMSAYTNSASIAKDMLNLANEKKSLSFLNDSYEYMGYYVYVLDYDSAQGKFFSFVDTKRSVLQNRTITTAGKQNELNFSYAYSYKDIYYIGGSIGVPRISYTSTTTHSEKDDKDSMKVIPTSTPSVYSTTYVDGLPGYYPDKLGFNSLTYSEYFTTSGSGINIKLGFVARVNEFLRLGAYYHSPSLLKLADTYYNTMSATFDKNPTKPEEYQSPSGKGGYYFYKIVTPWRIGFNSAFIVGKIAAIGLDYEWVDYKNVRLSSSDAGVFDGVNAVIKHKYSAASNIRAGVEFNLKPVMVRAGYNMQGSPFGEVFTGKFVRNTFSLGIGFRSKNNVTYDFCWYKTVSKEDYYFFNTIPQKAEIGLNNSMLAVTIGIKFK